MNSHEQLAQIYSQRFQSGHHDTSETVHVTGLALLKMLKHASSGVPIQIIGMLLGRFIDDYTVSVVDTFQTPFTGDTLNSEIENPYLSQMNALLSKSGRKEGIIGWYSSHSGTGLWLSAVDVNYHIQWGKQIPRSIAIVVDTKQSVKGKISIGAFRCIQHPNSSSSNEDSREITSFVGHLGKPTTKQLVRGLNKTYYQMPNVYRMSPNEQRMLESLHKEMWHSCFIPSSDFVNVDKTSLTMIQKLIKNAIGYRRYILEEEGMSGEELYARNIEKLDPVKVIINETNIMTTKHINQIFKIQVDRTTF